MTERRETFQTSKFTKSQEKNGNNFHILIGDNNF